MISQVYDTWPLLPDASEICALKRIFTVVPQAIAPKLPGFIEIEIPASCNGVLVPFGVGEDAGSVFVALDVDGVRDTVPDCDGVAPHALIFKPTNVRSNSVWSKRLNKITPWFQ